MSSELGRRIAFTLGALLIYRIGTYIPLPGINIEVWQQFFRHQSGSLIGMADILSGGAIHRLAIFALNIGPYVTAAILVQLFMVFFPGAAAVRNRGFAGRRIIERWTLGIAVAFTALQAYGIASGLEGFNDNVVTNPGLMFRLSTVVSLVGGTVFLIWLGELITLRGVGNGLALILFAGIVTEVPGSVAEVFNLDRQGLLSDNGMIGLVALLVAAVGVMVFIELARRRVPVEYAGRQIGDRVIATKTADLSIKLNSAGVIPVVAASWLLVMVVVAADFAGGFEEAWVNSVTGHLGPGQPWNMVYTALAIVILALLYTAFVLDPEDAAEKLKRHGGVIPGIAPGGATAERLDYVVSRTTVLGAVYLAMVYLGPQLLVIYGKVPIYIGGVSALIVVCVVLDIDAQVRGDRLNRLGG